MALSETNADSPVPPDPQGLAGHQAQSLPVNPYSIPETAVVVAEKPKVEEPSLPMIGFHLSKLVLYIISGFILLFVLFLFIKNFEASGSIVIPHETNLADTTFDRKLEMLRIIQEENKHYRDYTLQIAQIILLNLLLPVLTAILGYIFASNRNRE